MRAWLQCILNQGCMICWRHEILVVVVFEARQVMLVLLSVVPPCSWSKKSTRVLFGIWNLSHSLFSLPVICSFTKRMLLAKLLLTPTKRAIDCSFTESTLMSLVLRGTHTYKEWTLTKFCRLHEPFLSHHKQSLTLFSPFNDEFSHKLIWLWSEWQGNHRVKHFVAGKQRRNRTQTKSTAVEKQINQWSEIQWCCLRLFYKDSLSLFDAIKVDRREDTWGEKTRNTLTKEKEWNLFWEDSSSLRKVICAHFITYLLFFNLICRN